MSSKICGTSNTALAKIRTHGLIDCGVCDDVGVGKNDPSNGVPGRLSSTLDKIDFSFRSFVMFDGPSSTSIVSAVLSTSFVGS